MRSAPTARHSSAQAIGLGATVQKIPAPHRGAITVPRTHFYQIPRPPGDGVALIAAFQAAQMGRPNLPARSAGLRDFGPLGRRRTAVIALLINPTGLLGLQPATPTASHSVNLHHALPASALTMQLDSGRMNNFSMVWAGERQLLSSCHGSLKGESRR